MAATFLLKKNENNDYFFNLVNGAGDLILISGEYEDRSEAEQAIKKVQVGSLVSEQIAAGKAQEDKMFFVIKDAEGDVLVKSVLFGDRMTFDNALHLVKDNACIAEIQDQT